MRRQLAVRVASGSAMAALTIGAILVGPPALTLLGLVGGAVALYEVLRLTPPGVGRLPLVPGLLAVAALLLAAEAASGPADFLAASGVVLALWALAAALWFTAAYEGERPVSGFLLLLLGPVYAGFLLGHGLAIYDVSSAMEGADDLGRNWLLFTLAGTSASDTGAYAFGRLIGRHRMTPGLSPNKTWEGAAGGLIASVAAMLAVGALLEMGVELWQYAVAALMVAVVAQLGDLFESFLKRRAEAKDSGSIMPGHGGLLDRIDSILFALPAVYYLLTLVFGL